MVVGSKSPTTKRPPTLTLSSFILLLFLDGHGTCGNPPERGEKTKTNIALVIGQRLSREKYHTHLSQGVLNSLRGLGTIAKGWVGIDGIGQGHHAVPGVEDQLEGEVVRHVRVPSCRGCVCQ